MAAVCVGVGMDVEPDRVQSAELRGTTEFLDRWAEIIDLTDTVAKIEALNRLLRTSAVHPSITDHDGRGWHLHYRPPGLGLDAVLRSMITVGTALFLVTRGMHRIGRCLAEDCDRFYADLTRPGTQRYCSNRCANRDAVRRHRQRKQP